MVCCDSISHAEQISRISPRPTWTRSLYGSINVHGRPWDSKLLPIDYEWCCSDQLNPPPRADIRPNARVYEYAPRIDPYSTASSASASSVFGTLSPIAFAVFRLSTNRKCVGCSTGRSAGLVPLKMRSTQGGRTLENLAP